MLSELKAVLFNLLLHPNKVIDASKAAPNTVQIILLVIGIIAIGYIVWDWRRLKK